MPSHYRKGMEVDAFQFGEGVVDAMRYGRQDQIGWHPRAVQYIVRFITDAPDAKDLTDGDCLQVVEPTGNWDPPTNTTLILIAPPYQISRPEMMLGDWIVKHADGRIELYSPERFEDTFTSFAALKVNS